MVRKKREIMNVKSERTELMVTPVYARQHKQGLTLPQQSAVDLLASGKNDTETAELLELSRTAVTKWRLYSPDFQAALNQRRREIWGAAGDRLRALLPKALGVIEREMEGDNRAFRAAVEVLKIAGMAGASVGDPGPVPMDAETIIGIRVAARAAQKKAERDKYRSTLEMLAEDDNTELQRTRDEADAAEALREVFAEIAAKLADADATEPEAATEPDVEEAES